MKRVLLKILPKNRHIYSFCKSYVDKYNGENNADIRTNGELRVMQRTLGKCQVVFDIGAHIGEWTKLGLAINHTLKIHCFEPSTRTFEALTANEFPPNVVCNNLGFSSVEGEQTLFVFEGASGLNSLYQRHGLENGWGLETQRQQEQVKLDTLEHYCSRNKISEIDFMKIDVEGHELEVFKGGRQLFENARVKMIQFEYGGCNIDSHVFLKDIFQFFENFDYSFYKIYPEGIRNVPRYDQRLETFQYQNWLIIKKNCPVLLLKAGT